MKRSEILLHFLPFLILVSFLIGAYTDFSRKVSDEKHDMIQQLALTESNINKVTNLNISKMIGVTTYISINTDIDIEELDYFVKKVVHSENDIISNIGIFEDTTAIYLYPYEPNKDMSNINLVDIPTQKDDALRVKDDLKVVITRPVELVQGGIGIMTRMPIILPDGSYWGQLGYMMKLDDIIENLSLETDKYTYLITQYDYYNGLSHTVYDSGFEDKFLVEEVIVKLPSGYWTVQIGYINFFELISPVFYILIFSAIIFFGLSIYIISRFKTYNTELLHLTQRKELILKEVHHRIKNNFTSIASLLSLQSNSLTNPEAISALEDAIGRVHSMAVLYEKMLMEDDYSTTSVKSYLDNLIDDIMSLFSDNLNLKVEKQISDFELDPKTLVPIGIIVNELLTNIMKYAFTGRDSGLIEVTLTNDQGNVTLIVQDNGRGLPEEFDLENQKGFGLMLIKMLIQQLKGNLSIDNYNGARSILKFKI